MHPRLWKTLLCLALSSCSYTLRGSQDANAPTCADLLARSTLCGTCPDGTMGERTTSCDGDPPSARCTTVCTSPMPMSPGICRPNVQVTDPTELATFCGDLSCPFGTEASLRYALCNQQGTGVTCHLTCHDVFVPVDAGPPDTDASFDAGPEHCTPFASYNCRAAGCSSDSSGTKYCDRTGTWFGECLRDTRYACEGPEAGTDVVPEGGYSAFPQATLIRNSLERLEDISDGRVLNVSGMRVLPPGWNRMAVCLTVPRMVRERDRDSLAMGARLHLPASRVDALIPYAPFPAEAPQTACWLFTVEDGARRISGEYQYDTTTVRAALVYATPFGAAYIQGTFYAADVDADGHQTNVTDLYRPFPSASCTSNAPGFLRRRDESCFGLCVTEGFGAFTCH